MVERVVLDAKSVACLNGDQALALLKRWKDQGQVEELLDAACDVAVDSGSRWFAVRYLGSFSQDDVVVTLGELLADAEMRLRQQAARSLGEIGPDARAAVPALRRALFDGEGPVRVAAARALGAVGDRSASPDLVKAADTTAWDTLHGWLTDSLVKLGAPEASEHLVRRLSAEKGWQRRWAARELASLGDAASIEPLRRARSRDPLHRRTYTRAIRQIERRLSRAK